MFRNVMGYMGDRKYQYPDTLAQELVTSGLNGSEALRAELYVQIMKQLINNPSIGSETKGWEILSLYLSAFPPPSSVENHVAMFLREHCDNDKKLEKFTMSMHMVIYGGERTNGMSLSEIPNCVASFLERPVTKRYQKTDFVSSKMLEAEKKMERLSLGGGGDKPKPPPKKAGAGAGAGAVPPLPPPPPPSAEPSATVLFDYEPAEGQEGMIKLRKGSVVEIVNKEDGEWWLVKARSGSKAEGWVPASYLQNN